MSGFTVPALHVVASHGTSRDDLHHPHIDVVVHESVHLGRVDVHPAHIPPRTRLPRSVVDAASAAAPTGAAGR